MIQIIAGEKGKGKTIILIDKVNADVKQVKGNIVYLDKSNKNIYQLDKAIRLINVRDYCIETPEQFLGFVCGLIAENHDLQKIYLDSFLKITCSKSEDVEHVINQLNMISAKFQVDFIISLSMAGNEIPDSVKEYVSVSL